MRPSPRCRPPSCRPGRLAKTSRSARWRAPSRHCCWIKARASRKSPPCRRPSFRLLPSRWRLARACRGSRICRFQRKTRSGPGAAALRLPRVRTSDGWACCNVWLRLVSVGAMTSRPTRPLPRRSRPTRSSARRPARLRDSRSRNRSILPRPMGSGRFSPSTIMGGKCLCITRGRMINSTSRHSCAGRRTDGRIRSAPVLAGARAGFRVTH